MTIEPRRIAYPDPGPSGATNYMEVVDLDVALSLASRLEDAEKKRDRLIEAGT